MTWRTLVVLARGGLVGEDHRAKEVRRNLIGLGVTVDGTDHVGGSFPQTI